MKIKFMLKSIRCILTIIILFQIAPNTYAHPSSQKGILAESYISNQNYCDYYIGGENIGWSIDENFHSEKSYITYYFKSDDEYLNNNYKDDVRKAAAKWNGIVSIVEVSKRSSAGEICTGIGDDNVLAEFCEYKANSSGHLISWKIQLNSLYLLSINPTVIAHEFGHVIGLNDLYESKNSGKLMYGVATAADKKPTNSDSLGAQVITGQHVSHTWGYTYYGTSGQGMNSHVKYCTYCKGRTNTVSSCTYNSKNVCTYCGIPKGYSPYSINQEPQ